ncbi:MAG TPA: hypothetical protein VNS02_01930 [Rhizobiaceae bacterium]|nr:hypothetical protein [Rhizobiaceae bacterium]
MRTEAQQAKLKIAVRFDGRPAAKLSSKCKNARDKRGRDLVAGTGVDHNLRSTPVKMVAGGRTHHNLLFRAAA